MLFWNSYFLKFKTNSSFFSHIVVNVWNKLPASVVEASSVNVFKERVDDWISDVIF